MKLRRLRRDTTSGYTTFGCMWQKGSCTVKTAYRCIAQEGREVPIQSRVTAYWPDGSVKWTAHTADSALLGEEIEILPDGHAGGIVEADSPKACQESGKRDLHGQKFDAGGSDSQEVCPIPGKTDPQGKRTNGGQADLSIGDDGTKILINNGRYCIEINRDSGFLFERIYAERGEIASRGRAVLQLEEPASVDGYEARVVKPYTGVVREIEIEEQGALQCILKYTGCHGNKGGDRKSVV